MSALLTPEGVPPLVYIAGPVSGRPDGNAAEFSRAEALLRAAGYRPINPRRNGAEGERTWLGFMRQSLHQVAVADAVCHLDDWAESRGATVEVHLAKDVGIPVAPLREFIEEPATVLERISASRA